MAHTVGGTPTSAHEYVTNALNQRTSRADTGAPLAGAEQMLVGYNARGEVTSAGRFGGSDPQSPGSPIALGTTSYEFDDIGNRLSATAGLPGSEDLSEYTPNALNQYTEIEEPPDGGSPALSEPIYDHDGNLLSDGQRAYTWDAENRLIAVDPLAPANGSLRATYSYDHQSRRITKHLEQYNGSTWTELANLAWMWEAWNMVAEYTVTSGSATLARHWTWGLDLSGTLQGAGGVGGLLAAEEMSGLPAGEYHFAHDGHGNVTLAITGSGGTVGGYAYDAFGQMLTSTGGYAEANPVRYSSKYQDKETGFNYYGYRYYFAGTGRWVNRDPIDEHGGPSLSAFVENRPTMALDALGLVTLTIPQPPNDFPIGWPPRITLPRIKIPQIDLLPTHRGSHTMMICDFPKRTSISTWADTVYRGMQVFRHFTPNNSKVRIKGTVAEFRANYPLEAIS